MNLSFSLNVKAEARRARTLSWVNQPSARPLPTHISETFYLPIYALNQYSSQAHYEVEPSSGAGKRSVPDARLHFLYFLPVLRVAPPASSDPTPRWTTLPN